MNKNPLELALKFIGELEKLNYEPCILRSRDDALMIEVKTPLAKWEVEFFIDGNIEIEKFESSGEIHGGELLQVILEELK